VDIRINIDDAGVTKMFDAKTQRKIHRNMLDQMTRRVNKEYKARTARMYNIDARQIKTTVTKTTQNSLVASIIASKRFLSLARFNPAESGTGMSFEVVRGQSVFIDGAFIRQPKGVNYKTRGQKAPVVLKGSEVFKRLGVKPYPLDAKKMKEDESLSIGLNLKSQENMNWLNGFMRRLRPFIEERVISGMAKRAIKKSLGE
jgi:hypothetical protein